MGKYVVVEGMTEKFVYCDWIKYCNNKYECHFDIASIKGANDVYILSGNGYPQILDIIKDAVTDVNSLDEFDELIVSIDSEDSTFQEKYDEIDAYIKSQSIVKPYKIIIQHFSLEAWALGNQLLFKRHPHDPLLRTYINLFDVRVNNPENLPAKPDEGLNRAQFAVKYLKALFRERFRNAGYNKANPVLLRNKKYYARLVDRYQSTGHISSFQSFIDAFK